MARTTLTHNPRTGDLWTKEEKKVVHKAIQRAEAERTHAMKTAKKWNKFKGKKVFVTSRTKAWTPEDIKNPKLNKTKLKTYWNAQKRSNNKYLPNTTMWALGIVRKQKHAMLEWREFVKREEVQEVNTKREKMKSRLAMLKHHYSESVPPNMIQLFETNIKK